MFGEIKNHEDPNFILIVSNQTREKAVKIQTQLQNYYLFGDRKIILKNYGTQINKDGKSYDPVLGYFSVWMSIK